MTAEEFLCVRCSRHMKTCCQTCEIYTTSGDVARIETHTGRTDFTEYRSPANADYGDQDDDPLWRDRVFRADGTRRVLVRQENGDCTFLGTAGCILPLETRPLVCRLYPYEYSEEGIQVELATGCPLELLKPGQGLIQALEMNLADAQRWQKQLYEELLQEPDRQAQTSEMVPPATN